MNEKRKKRAKVKNAGYRRLGAHVVVGTAIPLADNFVPSGYRATDAPELDLHLPDTFRHCDEYIDDPSSPEPLRRYLGRARKPAHGMTIKEPYPKLFADYKGQTVRVVMASRLGDVGITTDLDADLGYQNRVAVSDLANFRETP